MELFDGRRGRRLYLRGPWAGKRNRSTPSTLFAHDCSLCPPPSASMYARSCPSTHPFLRSAWRSRRTSCKTSAPSFVPASSQMRNDGFADRASTSRTTARSFHQIDGDNTARRLKTPKKRNPECLV